MNNATAMQLATDLASKPQGPVAQSAAARVYRLTQDSATSNVAGRIIDAAAAMPFRTKSAARRAENQTRAFDIIQGL